MHYMAHFAYTQRIIRVKDLLKRLKIDNNRMQPIFSTANHPIIRLMLQTAHIVKLPEGTEIVGYVFQRKFSINRLQNTFWNTQSRWVKYGLKNANPLHPQMADQPRELTDELLVQFNQAVVE